MQEATALQPAICRNCGLQLTGEYCHGCGEKRHYPHDLSWRHFVHDAVHEFLHLDSKIFRTLWLLIARPGFLTAEYWAGRRTPYIRPLRVYLVIAALHLVAMTSHIYQVDFFLNAGRAAVAERFIEREAARRGTDSGAIKAAINTRIAKTYSVAQYFAVLGFATVPLMLYRRKRPHYVEHLIFSLHVYSVYFILSSFSGLVLTGSQWMRSPMPILTFLYLLFAVRHLYSESWDVAVAKALALRLGLFVTEFAVIGLALGFAFVLTAFTP